MEAGDFFGTTHSRIVKAIAEAETHTTGEIRVHISRRWFEREPLHRARRIFSKLHMENTDGHNAVLLYVNLRCRKFAFFGGEGIDKEVGSKYWQKIAKELGQDMRSTHYENAIAKAVSKIGDVLAKHYPTDQAHANKHKLSVEVTED